MPCNAVATARARVDLGALANVNTEALRNMLDEVCRQKFPYLYFRLDIVGNEVQVTGGRQYEMQQVLAFAQLAMKAICQKFLVAKIARQVKVTSQQVAANGAVVMEVEL